MRDQTAISHTRRVRRVQDHIQLHLHDHLVLEELADLAAMSPFHFHRIFRQVVGESLKEHIRRLRFEAAAAMLRHSKKSLRQIAKMSCYNTLESFTRAFKSHFGMAPAAFRESYVEQKRVLWGDCRARNWEQPQSSVAVSLRVVDLVPVNAACVTTHGRLRDESARFAQLAEWFEQIPERQIEPLPSLDSSERIMWVQMAGIPMITPLRQTRFHWGMEVGSENVPRDTQITAQSLPGGRFVEVEFVGTPEQRSQLLAWMLEEWLPASGYEYEPRCWRLLFASKRDAEQGKQKIYMPIR